MDLLKQLIDNVDYKTIIDYNDKNNLINKKTEEYNLFVNDYKKAIKNLINETIDSVRVDEYGNGFGSIYNNGFICTIYVVKNELDRILLDYSITSVIISKDDIVIDENDKKMFN